LTVRGLRQLQTLPKLFEALELLKDEMTTERAPGQCSIPVKGVIADAAWVEREVQNDFPLLHCHSVVALWSALEVMCEDLCVAWLENRADAWNAPEVAKLKVPLGEYTVLTPSDRAGFVVQELGRARASAFKAGSAAFESLLGVFDLAPAVGTHLRRALYEMNRVRHVVVHRGGRADAKLLHECPWLPCAVGELVCIPHSIYGWYHGAAYRYAERVLNQVLIIYGSKGCACPGMDDWRDRPEAASVVPAESKKIAPKA
jgi:hypothetical protein